MTGGRFSASRVYVHTYDVAASGTGSLTAGVSKVFASQPITVPGVYMIWATAIIRADTTSTLNYAAFYLDGTSNISTQGEVYVDTSFASGKSITTNVSGTITISSTQTITFSTTIGFSSGTWSILASPCSFKDRVW